jgi:hypothetical protein
MSLGTRNSRSSLLRIRRWIAEYRQTIEHQGEPEPAPESAPDTSGDGQHALQVSWFALQEPTRASAAVLAPCAARTAVLHRPSPRTRRVPAQLSRSRLRREPGLSSAVSLRGAGSAASNSSDPRSRLRQGCSRLNDRSRSASRSEAGGGGVSRGAFPDASSDGQDALEVFQLSPRGAGSVPSNRNRQSTVGPGPDLERH